LTESEIIELFRKTVLQSGNSGIKYMGNNVCLIAMITGKANGNLVNEEVNNI